MAGKLSRELILFALVGVLNTGFGFVVIVGVMYFFGVRPLLANAIGYGAGFVFSYFMNRTLTFSSKNSVRKEFLRFMALAVLAYLANFITVAIALRATAWSPYLIQPLGLIAYTGIMFVGSKFLVFRT